MKIYINTVEWEILETNTLDGILVVNSRKCKGVCDYGINKIHLLKDLRLDIKRQTLAHELTHAFLYQTQVEDKQKYDEEYICEFVARYSFQIWAIVDTYFNNNEEVLNRLINNPKR